MYFIQRAGGHLLPEKFARVCSKKTCVYMLLCAAMCKIGQLQYFDKQLLATMCNYAQVDKMN